MSGTAIGDPSVKTAQQGALAGYRVLDMGRVLSGPWAGQILGDMGADVIKIERPKTGDEGRQFGPETLIDANGRKTLSGSMFLCANRNKRSLTLDYSRPEGRQLLLDLVAQADVLIENFIPGTLAKHGLGYDALRAVNPGLVLCSISGYGQTGPHRGRPGYDAVFQAESGMMAVTGLPDDQPGGGPMKTGPSLVDVCTGVYAASAVLGALLHREKTGQGQAIDVTLLETALAMQTMHLQNYLLSGQQPLRRGNEGNGGHPARNFVCRDGQIYVSVGTTAQFHDLCRVIDRPDLAHDSRFQTGPGRLEHREAFNALFEPIVAQQSCRDLSAKLHAARIPNAVVKEYAEVLADEQVQAREIVRSLPHVESASGEVRLVGSPFRFSATEVQYRRAPPLVGEHSEEVLGELLGLADADIRKLRAAGIV